MNSIFQISQTRLAQYHFIPFGHHQNISSFDNINQIPFLPTQPANQSLNHRTPPSPRNAPLHSSPPSPPPPLPFKTHPIPLPIPPLHHHHHITIQHHPPQPHNPQPSPPRLPRRSTSPQTRLARPRRQTGDERRVSEGSDHEAEEAEFGGEEDGED